MSAPCPRFLLLAAAALLPAASLANPCDIYGAAGTPCVAAHSLTRALYANYAGPLYRLVRTPGSSRADIPVLHAGGTANGKDLDTLVTLNPHL